MVPYFLRLKTYPKPAQKERPTNAVFAIKKTASKSCEFTYAVDYATTISRGLSPANYAGWKDFLDYAYDFDADHLSLEPFEGKDRRNAYLMPRIDVAEEDDIDSRLNVDRLNLCDLFSASVDAYVLSYGFAEGIMHEDKKTRHITCHTQVSVMASITMTLNDVKFVSYGLFQYTFNEFDQLYHRAFKPFSSVNMGRLSTGDGRQALFDMLDVFFVDNVFKEKKSYTEVEKLFYDAFCAERELGAQEEYAEWILAPQLKKFYNV